ncbi:MAG: PEP-CTERM sorting domain-containing protein [Acidimicrobiia bacterium]|nr:PEP-CTERM sorting domain-containing protein [Acidimicrobiia bacterium]
MPSPSAPCRTSRSASTTASSTAWWPMPSWPTSRRASKSSTPPRCSPFRPERRNQTTAPVSGLADAPAHAQESLLHDADVATWRPGAGVVAGCPRCGGGSHNVPEPATLLLSAVGMGILWRRRGPGADGASPRV